MHSMPSYQQVKCKRGFECCKIHHLEICKRVAAKTEPHHKPLQEQVQNLLSVPNPAPDNDKSYYNVIFH